MRVLVADDDADLLDLLGYALRREGHEVVAAVDGQQALDRWRDQRPDLVLLDASMPKMDGFEVCRRIRAAGRTPVILLTGRRTEAEILDGLRSGADDYVPKPFRVGELLARVAAVLRRAREEAARDADRYVRWGDLLLDPEVHEVRRGGPGDQTLPIPIGRLQFGLLHLLAANAGQVVPYARLIEDAWGDYDAAKIALVRTHAAALRTLLGLPRSGPGALEAVPSVGYRLTRPAPTLASSA